MQLRAFLQVPLLAVLLALASVAGQAEQKVRAKTWTPPRTADGQPDLQGLWTNSTITPFERPKDLAGKEFFTEEEAVAYEKRVAANSSRDRRGDTAEADVAAPITTSGSTAEARSYRRGEPRWLSIRRMGEFLR